MSEHPVEISETRHVPTTDPDKFFLGHGYKELPYDLPVMMQVVRHIKDGVMVGWEVDMEVLSRGKVEVKILHPAGMAVLVDGVVVWRTPKG